MLAVKRVIIFEYKHRDLGWRQWHRFYDDFYWLEDTVGIRRDLGAAHGVPGIHRIPGQNRDVVALRRIQHDIAWKYDVLVVTRPASAIANVANRIYSTHLLAAFARCLSGATLR